MFQPMNQGASSGDGAGKDKFIRIRSNERLKLALAASAMRNRRKEADEARYLLERSLGLLDDEETPTKKVHPDSPKGLARRVK